MSEINESTLNQAVENILLSKGYKLTAQRKLIITILIKNIDKHVTVDDIRSIAKLDGISLSIPTIYRTLNILKLTKVIKGKKFTDEQSRYEITIKDFNEHYHLVCSTCGCIIEKTDFDFDVINQLLSIDDFICESWDLKITGRCKKCQH
jgi:Fur family ferric uptake transcriptional regulator